MLHIKFEAVTRRELPALRAQATIVFNEDGPLGGLQLKGFSVWESKKDDGALNVTFPSRRSAQGKEYWLLRSVDDDNEAATWKLRATILKEYAAWIRSQA